MRWCSLVLLVLLTACPDREAPPGPAATASAAAVDASVASTPSASTNASTSSSAPDASVVDAPPIAVPDLYAADGAVLGQTDAFPSLDSPTYKARIDLLWRAIVEDAPDVGAPCFFPLEAYQQVKAIPNPAADWKSRLMGAFVRDVHKYHAKLGDHPEQAKLLGLDVPIDKAKWMNPGDEGNKLGYDRVLHSTLRYQTGDGKEGKLDVVSMISWRGEWYVVHLAGFK